MTNPVPMTYDPQAEMRRSRLRLLGTLLNWNTEQSMLDASVEKMESHIERTLDGIAEPNDRYGYAVNNFNQTTLGPIAESASRAVCLLLIGYFRNTGYPVDMWQNILDSNNPQRDA